MIKVAIVIPYFQRKVGILRRALESILAQKLSMDTDITIIVVDDGSPISAISEVEELNIPSPFHLNLIEQANSGVAAARNAGLRNVTEDINSVAYLDSDDIWDPIHLTTALSALEVEFDCYFSDLEIWQP